jgi:hypothetical protein
MERQRLDAQARQWFGQAKSVQDTRGIRAHLDAGTDLAQLSRLLIDMHVDPSV